MQLMLCSHTITTYVSYTTHKLLTSIQFECDEFAHASCPIVYTTLRMCSVYIHIVLLQFSNVVFIKLALMYRQ